MSGPAVSAANTAARNATTAATTATAAATAAQEAANRAAVALEALTARFLALEVRLSAPPTPPPAAADIPVSPSATTEPASTPSVDSFSPPEPLTTSCSISSQSLSEFEDQSLRLYKQLLFSAFPAFELIFAPSHPPDSSLARSHSWFSRWLRPALIHFVSFSPDLSEILPTWSPLFARILQVTAFYRFHASWDLLDRFSKEFEDQASILIREFIAAIILFLTRGEAVPPLFQFITFSVNALRSEHAALRASNKQQGFPSQFELSAIPPSSPSGSATSSTDGAAPKSSPPTLYVLNRSRGSGRGRGQKS